MNKVLWGKLNNLKIVFLLVIIHYSLFIIPAIAQVYSPGETAISAQGNYTGPRAQDESAFFDEQDESAFFEPGPNNTIQDLQNAQSSQGQAQNYTTGCGPQGNGYKLCIPILGIDYIENSLAEYIKIIYRFALGLSGLLVFIMIVWGGIQYTISAGDTGLISDARDRIFQAILGMLLLFLSYIILNTINPDLISLREPNVDSVLLRNTPDVLPVNYDTEEEEKLREERVNTLTDINNTSDKIQEIKDELSNETDTNRQQQLQEAINDLENQKLEQQKEIFNNSIKDLNITIQQIENKKANSHWWTIGGSKFDSVDEKQLQSYYKQHQYFINQQKIIDSKLNN